MGSIAWVADGLLHRGELGAPVAVGSPGWFDWLAVDGVRSFSFRSVAGVYTARKERRQRGGVYWVAYRTAGGRQHKAYLGRSDDLTQGRLTEVALALSARVADAGSADAGEVLAGASPGAGESRRRVGPGGTGSLLLATKLFVPRPRPGLVPRPRLLARLDAGLGAARCSLISAPAGAGKTSLLAAWLAHLDRPVAWLTLGERDQDVHQVLRYLIAAFQTINRAYGRAALAGLDTPTPPPPDVVLTGLINDLAAQPASGLLVLDDYHLVRAPEIHAGVAFLLDHLPPSHHLVIATREDPPLPLPRLRARRELTEVRAADLGFTVQEASAFLGAGMGLRLSEPQVAALVRRTEGWAAGLQLAGLALRDRPDPAAFVDAFAGGHRLVADYLTTEVLERQPAPIRRFLLATCVLDRLCGPLCEAVLASDADVPSRAPRGAGEGQKLLEELERANLFVVPLDDERVWYRYHQLFADALRARLTREAGVAAAASLHRRASAWFGRQGLLPEAIHHALAGDAVDDAAVWTEALMPTLFASSGMHQALASWLAALPEPVVLGRPLLCLGQAWLSIHRADVVPAAAWVEAAERALPAVGDPRPARGAVAATRAFLATLGPDPAPERAGAWATEALADLAADDAAFRSVAGVSLGQAAFAQGQTGRAEQAFAQAAAAGQAAGLVHGAMVAVGYQVEVQRLRGARRRALATAREGLVWAGEHTEADTPVVGMLSALLADLLRDGNDLAAARSLAVEGLRAQRRYGNAPPLVLLAGLSLARLCLAEGDVASARAVLAESRPVVAQGPFAALAPLLDACEAEVCLATGDGADAVSWATGVEPMGLPRLFRFETHFFAAGVEALGVTAPRVLVVHGRSTGDAALLQHAEHRLEAGWQVAQRQELGWLRLRVLILRAMIADAMGDHHIAMSSLAAAVAQAAQEGVVRPFVDEGAPMVALLTQLRETALERLLPVQGASSAFLDTLLAAFPGREPAQTAGDTDASGRLDEALVEPLTSRELGVLRLLADGQSNADMARDLFIEQSTVKTHLVHLYRKLDVHSRTQAVARARALRLLG